MSDRPVSKCLQLDAVINGACQAALLASLPAHTASGRAVCTLPTNAFQLYWGAAHLALGLVTAAQHKTYVSCQQNQNLEVILAYDLQNAAAATACVRRHRQTGIHVDMKIWIYISGNNSVANYDKAPRVPLRLFADC